MTGGAALIVASSTVLCAQSSAPQFRTELNLVSVDAAVSYRGNAATGLTKDDFAIFEDGQYRPILYFGSEATPVDILLLLDVSGSMLPEVQAVADRARLALACLREGDQAALMVFAWRPRLYQPLTGDHALLEQRLQEVLARERFGGRTMLNNGLFGAAEHLLKEPRTASRRAILMITDNLGLRSQKDSTVLRELWEANAVLYVLHMTNPRKEAWKVRPMPFHGVADMRPFVEQTGGEWLKPDRDSNYLLDALERIRKRYLLMFRATPGKSGTVRSIRVELSSSARSRMPDATILARRAYRLN